MKLIPVIDLVDGRAVWARRGQRDRYLPLATTLCPDGDPVALAARFVEEFGSDTLYLADIDAISGRGTNLHVATAIASGFPRLELWVDAGLSDRASLRRFDRQWPGRPVIGSETLQDTDTLRAAEASGALLSLDYRGDRLIGPADLALRAREWPDELILMSLERVGTGRGPELERLAGLMSSAGHRQLYAAGGVLGIEDLHRLRSAGAAGVLLASALHEGRITAADATLLGSRQIRSER